MWKIHGVDTARRRSFIRSLYPKGLNFKKRFLVKNLDFSAPPDIKAGLYTHSGISAQKQNGVPGQGKKNPQFDFGDHVIVTHNGNYFDPSYGIDGFATDKDYVEFAIGGLGGNGSVGFTMADATPQFISNECVEYNRGFIQYKISQDLCMAGLAARLAVSEDLVLHWNPGLKAWRGPPTGVEVGDEVEIPSGVQYINVTSTNPFSAIALWNPRGPASRQKFRPECLAAHSC